jgi:hypothetical protein
LIALGSIYHKGYTSGYDASEKAVEARTAASVKAALALQAQRQRTVDTAEEAHRAMLQHTIETFKPIKEKVYVYRKSHTAPCLDAAGSLLAKDAIDSANAGITNTSVLGD